MQVDRITLIVAPEKLPRANGMQLMYTKDNGKVRNIYVCADTGAVRHLCNTVIVCTLGVEKRDIVACSCPYLYQIFSNFKNSFTGKLSLKSVMLDVLRDL